VLIKSQLGGHRPRYGERVVESGVMSVPYCHRAPLRTARVGRLVTNRDSLRSSGAGGQEKLSKRQGDIVGQFIRAMVEATHYLKTRPAAACEYWQIYTH